MKAPLTSICRQFMRRIIDVDQSRPGICTAAALAQAQFNLSQILAMQVGETTAGGEESSPLDTAFSERLEESALLAHRARKILVKPTPLEPLTRKAADSQQAVDSISTSDPNAIPKEHELALFDHIQPVFDGRFTGLHLLQYLQYLGGHGG